MLLKCIKSVAFVSKCGIMTIKKGVNTLEKVYTIEETADILKIPKRTIMRMIHDKRISAIRLGKGYRIKENELKRILEEGVK